MAFNSIRKSSHTPAVATLLIFSLLHVSLAARMLTEHPQQTTTAQDPSSLLNYHRGPLLSGKVSVNLIWYGKFTPTQRSIISDFIASLSSAKSNVAQPSVTTWWASIAKYYQLANMNPSSPSLSLGTQIIDDSYSLGHSLTNKHLIELASKPDQLIINSISVVLTASDVAVEGFCSSRCGTHGSSGKADKKSAYIWVGNSESQCPGQCAWPFHQPIYGPQSPPLVAPNNDVGLDGMVINLASLLAGTVTNPFGNGFFQGPKEAPLEAASACPGVYGKGAYPGYAGSLLVDPASGASYNAHGENGRKYLLPALLNRAATPAQPAESTPNEFRFQYHNGPLLSGRISINLIWYGKFTPSQRAIITDFITSLSSPAPKTNQPSVATWWKGTHRYYRNPSAVSLSMGAQILDEAYSMGKSLSINHIQRLAARGGQPNAINVVFTAADVAVDGFCMSRCGTHGSSSASRTAHLRGGDKNNKFAYAWVGNPETQCPGQCAWPFHQPIYGPQSPPLVAPNNDVGLDGMVMNLASLLAGTVTNPFGNGYYQGPKEAPLEAASACPGVYGKGAYPGYAGNLLVDRTTGASYNANGVNGRKYLLPALYDPTTSSCSTLL
ncbi:hypothetical protein Cgig2_026724 [Carnegiea gigantea]|uniref:Uncharacterized protein n=1 Tax=Carnegiea gigantea TaxID=171969 RepID=A0A9Q1JW61_9CARY|nr:hypothetical protein Cgig2_026724 [Carnegiea gigantea]